MLIQIINVSKKYRSGKVAIDALNDVSLNISRGEFVALSGPSGSGKSTLLNIIGCLTHVSSGRYLLDNQEVSHWPDHFLASIRMKRMGFIFQQFNLITGFSAWENVAMPLVPSGISKKNRKKRALDMLEKLNIDTRADFMAQELSGGQQQLVAVARALINDPEIILADEPFSNIDIKHVENLKNIFAGLKNQGKTIIVTSHANVELNSLMDKKFIFENGSNRLSYK